MTRKEFNDALDKKVEECTLEFENCFKEMDKATTWEEKNKISQELVYKQFGKPGSEQNKKHLDFLDELRGWGKYSTKEKEVE